ncbi:MAG: secretin and TonB N-terminal domain-containing protein [Thermoguttaceae bacterium]
MKTAGRLIAISSFAALGVGLAVCVAVRSSAPAKSNPGILAAEAASPSAASPRTASEKAPVCDRGSEPESRKPEVRNLPAPVESLPPTAPPGPSLAAAAPSYGQEVLPAPGGQDLSKALDAIRKGLAEQQAPPANPPQPPTAKAKSSIDGEGDGKLRIHIYDEDIRKVLDLLSEQGNLNILASKNVEGKVSASLNGVDVQGALAAILKSTGFVARREGNFLFVGTPEDFNNIEQAMDRVGTRTYRPNYVTSAELKALITPLLTEKIGVLSVSTPSESGIALNDTAAGGDRFTGNEVLVVRDYEAVLCQIDQLVSEVDVRPMQVAIEAMILSIKLDDTDKFGVNFQLLRQNPDIKFGLGSPSQSLSDAAAPTGFPLNGGLKFGFLDGTLGAFLDALEQIGDTNVIANPRLMVLNKQRAEIQIGEKQGYISQTITETTSTQSVEFLDTGTQLRLRPFITSDGVIRMEVHPELSDGEVTVEPSGVTLPNKRLTGVTTNIMVRDGCTMVIGGLIHEQLTNTSTQLPVLGNLPYIGFLFRQKTETTQRQEVLVLITPRIVYEPGTCQEGQQAKCEFLRRQSTYADKMSPLGKRSIARRYYRLADSAYAAGEMHKALRFAEMAVQFDPLNRAALELRSDIWLKKPYRPHPSSAEYNDCLTHTGPGEPAGNPLDAQAMPDWLVNDLEGSAPPPMPLHPLDPGIPGKHRDLVRPRILQ